MKRIFILVQLAIAITTFSDSARLTAQAVSGLRPNRYYRSFAPEIATAAKQMEQLQRGTDLARVLSAEQIKRYTEHLAVWRWQFKAVDTYVYTVYLKGTYVSMEEKNKAYDEYMLSFYKN
jgi:hypothetical protein